MRLATSTFAIASLFAVAGQADEPQELLTSPLAEIFGAQPLIEHPQLSPNGTRLVAIQRSAETRTRARVFDLDDGSTHDLLAGEPDVFQISWCDWLNDTRLLCALRSLSATTRDLSGLARLVADVFDT